MVPLGPVSLGNQFSGNRNLVNAEVGLTVTRWYISSVVCKAKLENSLGFPHMFRGTIVLLTLYQINTVRHITVQTLVDLPFNPRIIINMVVLINRYFDSFWFSRILFFSSLSFTSSSSLFFVSVLLVHSWLEYRERSQEECHQVLHLDELQLSQ